MKTVSLSERGLQTLELLCAGYSFKEIASMQSHTEESVKKYVKRLRTKFKCRSTYQLIANYTMQQAA